MNPSSALQKKTNWWGAFVIGLAGTILVTGIGPFAVQSMGAAAIPVFFLTTAGGVILCLCLAELAAMMPHRTGGLPSYAVETYKDFGPASPGTSAGSRPGPMGWAGSRWRRST